MKKIQKYTSLSLGCIIALNCNPKSNDVEISEKQEVRLIEKLYMEEARIPVDEVERIEEFLKENKLTPAQEEKVLNMLVEQLPKLEFIIHFENFQDVVTKLFQDETSRVEQQVDLLNNMESSGVLEQVNCILKRDLVGFRKFVKEKLQNNLIFLLKEPNPEFRKYIFGCGVGLHLLEKTLDEDWIRGNIDFKCFDFLKPDVLGNLSQAYRFSFLSPNNQACYSKFNEWFFNVLNICPNFYHFFFEKYSDYTSYRRLLNFLEYSTFNSDFYSFFPPQTDVLLLINNMRILDPKGFRAWIPTVDWEPLIREEYIRDIFLKGLMPDIFFFFRDKVKMTVPEIKVFLSRLLGCMPGRISHIDEIVLPSPVLYNKEVYHRWLDCAFFHYEKELQESQNRITSLLKEALDTTDKVDLA